MRLFFACALVFLGSLRPCYADVVALPNTIDLNEDISNWNAKLSDQIMEHPELKKTGLIECAELKNLRTVVLCASTKKTYMNKALSRASIFSEGTYGVEKGNVQSSDSPSYLNIVSAALGHDIPSNELLAFWQKLEEACQKKETCPTQEEEEFFKEVVLPLSQKESQFVLISYSVDTEWYHTLSHELMHAQYFLDAKFRQTVDRFWNESVSEQDRNKIKSILGKAYNQNDEFVMKNEFQAYVLERHFFQDFLKDQASIYREALIQSLKSAGTPPLDFK